jgi:hypothetical protein
MVSIDEVARIALELPVTKRALQEALVDGWLASAPPKLADAYIAENTQK